MSVLSANAIRSSLNFISGLSVHFLYAYALAWAENSYGRNSTICQTQAPQPSPLDCRCNETRGCATRALTIDRGVQIRAWSELILGICQRDIGHHLISFLTPSTASYIHPCSTRKKHPSAKNNQTTDEKFRWMREHLAKIP